jgi:Protein of unknown function (DUF4058)
MAGPFPGMDPYIECQNSWSDFHNRLIAEIGNALGAQLPDAYVARVDERIEVANSDGPNGVSYRPDVLVARQEKPAKGSRGTGSGAVITLEPRLIDVSFQDPEEIRHTWLEIRRLPSMELITVVEVLSPANKTGMGRQEYLEKRQELQAKKINVVEIDLLIGGLRVPMKEPLRNGDYFAIVARGHKLPTAEVYSWSVRDRLPAIPIPLRPPDSDVPINLEELVGRVYSLGRYNLTLRHDEALPDAMAAFLHPDDQTWVEEIRHAR